MRVLLDQGTHEMRNKGSNALLQAAVDKFESLWTDLLFDLVSLSPMLSRIYFPSMTPVHPQSLKAVTGRFDRVKSIVPNTAWMPLLEMREAIWHRRQTAQSPLEAVADPETAYAAANGPTADVVASRTIPESLLESITRYDLVVATGGSLIHDDVKGLAFGVLERLGAATAQGIPTAMVSQGFGPIDDPALRSIAASVLPKVDLIFVREDQVAIPLLQSLGVSRGRIKMTGDGAIQMAYNERQEGLGSGIGVGLRIAGYTRTDDRHVEILRSTLQAAARRHHARLVALPISGSHHESDSTHIGRVLTGYNRSWPTRRRLDGHDGIIKRASNCRIVVTGSFHAAVFALSQGVPVVALAKQANYAIKFEGLHHEFGSGCRILSLDDDHLQEKLGDAVESAWSTAEEQRPILLDAAARQIAQRDEAYLHFNSIIRN